MENIRNAYTEVLVILRNTNNGIYTIPYDVLQKLKNECNLNHEFKLKENVPLSEQNLLSETKAILAIFYRDYWANNEQYKLILQKEENDRILFEQRQSEKYNPNDIFSKNNSYREFEKDTDNLSKFFLTNNENKHQLIKQNDSILVKIKNIILKIFHK